MYDKAFGSVYCDNNSILDIFFSFHKKMGNGFLSILPIAYVNDS